MSDKKLSVAAAKKPGAATTNKTKSSLVKVVVLEDIGNWMSPASGERFFITAEPSLPTIVFQVETKERGPYKWKWVVQWEARVSGLREKPRGAVVQKFSASGTAETSEARWTADFAGKILGGLLTVELWTASERFERSVYVLGKNPTAEDVQAFAAKIPDIKGFDKLLEQETHVKHFIDLDGEPIVAFDKGYGLTQITNPSPSFEQVWNWKENLKVGSSLYAK